MHDLIYEFAASQDSSTSAADDDWIQALASLAEAAWVPQLDSFLDCLTQGETVPRVSSDMSAARRLEILGTPTYLIDGLAYTGLIAPRLLLRRVRRTPA